jgi:hypothetical protein
MRPILLTRAEEVRRAYGKVCRLTCSTCGHRCPTQHVYSHVFDHCGDRVVHRLDSQLEQRVVPNPLANGYAVGVYCRAFRGTGVLQVRCGLPPHDSKTHVGYDENGNQAVWTE